MEEWVFSRIREPESESDKGESGGEGGGGVGRGGGFGVRGFSFVISFFNELSIFCFF